jgi:hypothetical protein
MLSKVVMNDKVGTPFGLSTAKLPPPPVKYFQQ